MSKECVIQKLKDNGCRITKQRLILLDIILEGNCNSCKEIYYKAAKKDSSIGTATVYRMIIRPCQAMGPGDSLHRTKTPCSLDAQQDHPEGH